MAETAGKRYMVSCKNTEEKICLDAELVLEVAENLVSNALRYARTEVAVDIRMAGKELELTVMDDGSGFTVSTQQAMKAYFCLLYTSYPDRCKLHKVLSIIKKF